jgi:hypothetical protein
MRYFDKNFWQMFFGFLAIISVALVLIFGLKAYQSNRVEFDQNNFANTVK